MSLSRRATKWPYDFTAQGHVRHTRIPASPAVWLMRDNTPYYPEYQYQRRRYTTQNTIFAK